MNYLQKLYSIKYILCDTNNFSVRRDSSEISRLSAFFGVIWFSYAIQFLSLFCVQK